MQRMVVERKPHIVFRSSQTGLSKEDVVAFWHRQDVSRAHPYFSQRRKIRLEKVAIETRNGEIHDYFLLRQGKKKRFLFDQVENPDLFSDLDGDPAVREKQIEKRLSFTSAVPQKIMRDEGILPAEGQVFRRFRSRKDVRHTLRAIERQTYWMIRGNPKDPKSLESNPDFIQAIPSLTVRDQRDNIQFSVRGKAHDERLSGMLIPFLASGHIDPGDSLRRFKMFLRYGLKYALLREIAEETAMRKKDQPNPFHIFPKHGKHDFTVTPLGILRLLWHYRISPLGVVYMENEPVDKVHAGIVYEATPRRRNKSVRLTLNGNSEEGTKIISLSPTTYRDAITTGLYEEGNPKPNVYEGASWADPIVNAIESQSTPQAPQLRRRTFRAFDILRT